MSSRTSAGFAGAGLMSLLVIACADSSDPGTTTQGTEPPRFVGRESCAACHAQQNDLWTGSHHDLAMQPADSSSVLGDFGDATFTYNDVTTTFTSRDGQFIVRTDGPDGELTDYPVAYTFGTDPLQQYLIQFPGGRMQALSISWDARPREDGGQRWFHLYPDDEVTHEDVLHWTGFAQNWNRMCAECHSTNLQKHYDAATDQYATTWSDLDVACEACHGPGSRHLTWAEAAADGSAPEGDNASDRGLVVDLRDRDAAVWNVDSKTGLARRSVPRESRTEVELCARCHSRRSVLSEDYVHGRPLMDTHRPALLTEPLYYSAGQIRDEVYVYGSFLQSKMYQRGVTCSDCHDPHALGVRAEGNARCAACHLPDRFDSPDHHFHEPGSAGAICVACHMPERTYMGVDARRDHSFRIPRPDLTISIGTPNACTTCHAERSPQWADEAVTRWYGATADPHYGETLDRARRGEPGLGTALAALAGDPDIAPIVRATAVSALQAYPGPDALRAVTEASTAADPLLRLGAVGALDTTPPDGRLGVLLPLLDDPIRAVRLDAARSLAAVPQSRLTPAGRASLDRALEEYVTAQRINADRAEAHVNLGVLHAGRDDLDAAATEFQTAIDRNPFFVPAYVNLAEVYRLQGRDTEGERVLLGALERLPGEADLHHALGLVRVRLKRQTEALDSLERAATLMPERARYSYVYAVALNSSGRGEAALAVLGTAHARHPGDVDIVAALATRSRDAGDVDAAEEYARRLVDLVPNDPRARQLLAQLEAAR